MDREQEIKEIQQLIATATGDTLNYLVKRLDALLEDKSEQEQSSPPIFQLKTENMHSSQYPSTSTNSRKYIISVRVYEISSISV
jgi:hypothetical protein